MTQLRRIKRALISVSNKTGAVELAKSLKDLDVEIISTGGTARELRNSGIDVLDVSDVTGFPEMMDGRVKTLHPKIHGAFLALRDDPSHLASMAEHSIEAIDLVVVDLYPFEETIAREGATLEAAVENIDIGGPAMIRSASKNWRDVAVVTDPRLYSSVIEEMRGSGGALSLETRRRFAALAYARTASYDLAISTYLAEQLSAEDRHFIDPLNPLAKRNSVGKQASEKSVTSDFPKFDSIELSKVRDLRYGENPHQRAALYTSGNGNGIASAEQLHGKEMSFNNYVDADAAWSLIREFDEPAVAIIKHTNPSGVGIGKTNEEAYRRALSTDPVSAFGGIVAFNRMVDEMVANSVNEVFTEVVIAPDFEDSALQIFRTKKNLRVLRIRESEISGGFDYKQISGGFLVQDKDTHRISADELRVVTEKEPSDKEMKALLLAWQVCKHVKSNAIVFANENRTLGVGAGQMNRVDSVRIAAMRAERFELPILGAAMASDAFFPFRDNVDEAAKYGISAIIQPGGSVRDEETIAAANEHGISMVFTGIRHFKH